MYLFADIVLFISFSVKLRNLSIPAKDVSLSSSG